MHSVTMRQAFSNTFSVVEGTVKRVRLDGCAQSVRGFGMEAMVPMLVSPGMCLIEWMPRKRLQYSDSLLSVLQYALQYLC